MLAPPEVVEREMFGGLAFLIRGKMTIVASSKGGLMTRADPATTASFVETTAAEFAEIPRSANARPAPHRRICRGIRNRTSPVGRTSSRRRLDLATEELTSRRSSRFTSTLEVQQCSKYGCDLGAGRGIDGAESMTEPIPVDRSDQFALDVADVVKSSGSRRFDFDMK